MIHAGDGCVPQAQNRRPDPVQPPSEPAHASYALARLLNKIKACFHLRSELDACDLQMLSGEGGGAVSQGVFQKIDNCTADHKDIFSFFF